VVTGALGLIGRQIARALHRAGAFVMLADLDGEACAREAKLAGPDGPEMHRWHHTIDITEGGINFGTKFAFWDWLFGTAYLPTFKPRGYGVQGLDFPRGYPAQVLHAFRRSAPPAADRARPRDVVGAARVAVGGDDS
jgi:hypothetical protein